MEVSPKSQIAELIRSSQNILLLSHADPDGDAIGSTLALALVLQKLNKTFDIVISGRPATYCSFLPLFDRIKPTVATSNELVITIDTRQTGEELKLGHKKLSAEHQVMIVISPEKGALLPEDVTVTRSKPAYDLIVFLDCSDAERIGTPHQALQEMLYEIPTVSIDHHATSAHFAKINWVDMTASSTAEMLVSLIESVGRNENLLDADVATCLLTGLMSDTGSFRNENTTPKALTVGAQLVAAGARQQEIVEKIFRTKPLSTLRMWGTILSNMKEENDGNFVWTTITAAEAMAAGADPSDSAGVIDNLLKSAAGVNFVLLLSERGDKVHGSFRSVAKGFNVAELAQLFGGGGHIPAAGFELTGQFESTVADIIAKIKTKLAAPKA